MSASPAGVPARGSLPPPALCEEGGGGEAPFPPRSSRLARRAAHAPLIRVIVIRAAAAAAARAARRQLRRRQLRRPPRGACAQVRRRRGHLPGGPRGLPRRCHPHGRPQGGSEAFADLGVGGRGGGSDFEAWLAPQNCDRPGPVRHGGCGHASRPSAARACASCLVRSARCSRGVAGGAASLTCFFFFFFRKCSARLCVRRPRGVAHPCRSSARTRP